MAGKEHAGDHKKRKRGPPPSETKPSTKKPKRVAPSSKPPGAPRGTETAVKKYRKPVKPLDGKKTSKFPKGKAAGAAPAFADTQEPMSTRERRLMAKEVAEARKKRRKPHYSLEQELASLWEKMRRRDIAKKERSKLISEALQKMCGKIHEIATSHVTSRVLQTCVNYCSQEEKDKVFEELRPHLLTLSNNAYAVHLVKKMLDNASKSQFEWFISSLHGHVSSLLRHMVGSVVIEHAFHLGNGSQKRRLLMELYSTELQLFKDLTLTNESRLVGIISKLGLQKSSVLHHMASVIQPILEKGIVDHSIIHTLLAEYFSIADKTSATDVIQHLSGSLLIRMIHTKDGSKVGILCVKHGNAKERKKIVKSMKGLIGKIAYDQYSSLVLSCLLSVVDDTKLLTKIVIRELQTILKDLVLDKNGRRSLLQLLSPQSQKYLAPADVASLCSSIPSLSTQPEEPEVADGRSSENVAVNSVDAEKSLHLADGGKKPPAQRRYELLVNSGLAESLIDTCIDMVGEMLRSNFGKDVLYEVASGGADAVLFQTLSEKLGSLYEAVASLAATPKVDEPEEEHIFENFHSSRIIRKLILSCPAFATTLWKLALQGKCKMWAQGHSLKVVSAFLESSDSAVKNLACSELQPLIDAGVFKTLENKQVDS